MSAADYAKEWGGLAHSVPGLDLPACDLGVDPAEAERVAAVPEDEGRGQGLELAAEGTRSRTWSNLKIVILAWIGPDRGPGGWSGTRVSSTRCSFLTQDPQGCRPRPPTSLIAVVAGDRHAGLHLLRLAVRPRSARKPIIMAGCLIAAITYFPDLQRRSRTTPTRRSKSADRPRPPIVVTSNPAECSFPVQHRSATAKFVTSLRPSPKKARWCAAGVAVREPSTPRRHDRPNQDRRRGGAVLCRHPPADLPPPKGPAMEKAVTDTLKTAGYPAAGRTRPGIDLHDGSS